MAIGKSYEVIELNRNDVGDDFADAAKSVVHGWDDHTSHLFARDWDSAIVPPLAEREATLRTKIPITLRSRVAPGH